MSFAIFRKDEELYAFAIYFMIYKIYDYKIYSLYDKRVSFVCHVAIIGEMHENAGLPMP